MTDSTEHPLGLILDDDDPRDKRSFVVIYGDPKRGKSTSVAQTYSDCLWITSESAVLSPYASWYAKNQQEARERGLKDPRKDAPPEWKMARKTLPHFESDGVTLKNTWGDLESILIRCRKAMLDGSFPYRGIVLDEFNVLADRVLANMQAACNNNQDPRFKTNAGKPNMLNVWYEIIKWTAWVCSTARIADGRYRLVTVHHAEDPDPTVPLLGGPKMPSKKSRAEVERAADLIVRVYQDKVATAGGLGFGKKSNEPEVDFGEEEVSTAGYVRRLQLESCKNWMAGGRSFDLPTRAKMDLPGVLLAAGIADAPQKEDK